MSFVVPNGSGRQTFVAYRITEPGSLQIPTMAQMTRTLLLVAALLAAASVASAQDSDFTWPLEDFIRGKGCWTTVGSRECILRWWKDWRGMAMRNAV